MNEYFSGISDIEGLNDKLPEDEVYDEIIPLLENISVSQEEVATAMKNLKINSSPGPDGITNLSLCNTSETM